MSLKTLSASLFCSLSFSMVGAEPLSSDAEVQDRVVGQRFTLSSKMLSGEREIEVYLPDSYHRSVRRYPVVYVLDSDYLFGLTVNILRNRWSRGLAPESIVVGIRVRDNHERFSFAVPLQRLGATLPKKPDTASQKTPSNHTMVFADARPDLMAKFFRQELLTYIDGSYRSNGYRLVIGMSPTATNVVYDYLSDEPLFDAHIALAADFLATQRFSSYDKQVLVQTIEDIAGEKKREFIFFSLASQDAREDPRRGAPIHYLNNNPENRKNGVHGFIPEDTEHYSQSSRAIEEAFSRLFPTEQWQPDYVFARKNPQLAYQSLTNFYQQLEHRTGYPVYPLIDGYWTADSVLGVVRILGAGKHFEQALKLLNWAISSSPKEPWVHFYLSLVYENLKLPKAALKHAKLSVYWADIFNHPDSAHFMQHKTLLANRVGEESGHQRQQVNEITGGNLHTH